jgi:hypothetical protein
MGKGDVMKGQWIFGHFMVFGLVLLLAGITLAQAPAFPADKAAKGPGQVIAELYDLVSATGGKTPDWDKVRACFLKEAVIVLRTTRTATTVFSLDGFIQDFVDFYEKPFRRGALTLYPNKEGFTEKVVRMKSFEFWDMALVRSPEWQLSLTHPNFTPAGRLLKILYNCLSRIR